MNSKLRVSVVGAGGLGTLIGGLLAEGGASVALVNPRRREHMEAINDNGLIIESEAGERMVPCEATIDFEAVGKVDLFILCVKAPQTEEAMGSSASMIGDKTIALSLQNGIGCEEIMAAAIGAEKVIGAMTMQGGVYVSPGRIRHINVLPTYLGELDGAPTARVREIGDIFNNSGIETIVTEDVRRHIWTKVLYCLVFDPISAICRFKVGEIFDVEAIRELMPEVIEEGVQVGNAQGIPLGAEDVEWALEMARKAGGTTRSDQPMGGVQIDLLRQRKSDAAFKTGAIVDLGERHGIPTPINKTLWAMIQALERDCQ